MSLHQSPRAHLAEFADAHALPGIHDLVTGTRFLAGLIPYLRHPIAIEQARSIVSARLERREADFLGLARRLIFAVPGSPYLELLRLAGCEYGDLQRLVHQEGVEGALAQLYRRGVYLTGDEFKGRCPLVRGSATIWIDPRKLCNPRSTVHLVAHTSGSGGTRTAVPFDLASGWDHAVDRRLVLEARGARGWPLAVWGLPGGAEIIIVLRFTAAGAPPQRWFSQLDPSASGLHPRYRWSGRVLRWGGWLAGLSLPSPQYVPLHDPLPIAHWMQSILRDGGTPHLKTFVSAAVRLCQAARASGIVLDGAQFTVIGEPLTAARLAEIRQAGATAVPEYGSVEAGSFGEACLAPDAPDDVHLLHDLVALIQPESRDYAASGDGPSAIAARRGSQAGGGVPPGTLLVSSLRPTTPLILLNLSMGDRATRVRRSCGCPMERFGWTTHFHTIRSFEKLTGAGMTFSDTAVIRLLDEDLPRRFGGGPTDYQLVEEETMNGHSRITLRIHPRVGTLDPAEVTEIFLSALGATSGIEHVMELLWRQASVLHIDRRPPVAQENGKILHLFQDSSASPTQPSLKMPFETPLGGSGRS